MTQPTTLIANPFALMLAPEAIFAAIEHSERLSRLKSRICRPLDGPRPAAAAPELGAFDEAVEAAVELPEPIECAATDAPAGGTEDRAY
jgi:hypothetical protein